MKNLASWRHIITLALKKPIIASMVGITILFSIHFIFPSYINGMPKKLNFSIKPLWHSSLADDTYQLRTSFSEFSKRPFTIGIQKIMYELHIPHQFSFSVVVFTSLFLCCLCLNRIAKILRAEKHNSYQVIYSFIFSFSILFAFMRPMDTYDDPLQYLLLLLSILLFLEKKDIMAMIVFTLSCIARETSFLLLPFFLVTQSPSGNNRTNRIILWALPMILYFAYFYLILNNDVRNETISFSLHHRLLGWTENFKNINATIISLTNAFLILALPMLIIRLSFNQFSNENRKTIQLAEILVSINLVITLVSGLASESRLFALPLLLIWPLLPQALHSSYIRLIENIKAHSPRAIIIFLLSIAISFLLFNPVAGKIGILYKAYLSLYLSIFLILLTRPTPVHQHL